MLSSQVFGRGLNDRSNSGAVFFPVLTCQQKIEIYFFLYSTLIPALSTSIMPTMKQVDEMITKLASRYHFSEDDARRFLDLTVQVKTKPKSIKTSGTLQKTPSASSYHNFLRAESANVRQLLMAEYGVSKLERGQLQKKLGEIWKSKSDIEKLVYSQ